MSSNSDPPNTNTSTSDQCDIHFGNSAQLNRRQAFCFELFKCALHNYSLSAQCCWESLALGGYYKSITILGKCLEFRLKFAHLKISDFSPSGHRICILWAILVLLWVMCSYLSAQYTDLRDAQ